MINRTLGIVCIYNPVG